MEHATHAQFQTAQTAHQQIQTIVLYASIIIHPPVMVMVHAYTLELALPPAHHAHLIKFVNLALQDIL